jgi:hypothetical protein
MQDKPTCGKVFFEGAYFILKKLLQMRVAVQLHGLVQYSVSKYMQLGV